LAGKVNGAHLELELVHDGQPVRVTGTVDGDHIAATVIRGSKSARYVATRG
jgi:hypothetical protein